MSSDIYARIIELRRKRKSYGEIAGILGVAKSTVSYWVAKNPESIRIKKILTEKNIRKSRVRIRKIIKATQLRWEKWREKAAIQAGQEFFALKGDPLFISGVMLYWGEGDGKTKNSLRFTNTDPKMMRLYVLFLKKAMHIATEKIHLELILYPDLPDETCKKFWSQATGLPQSNFWKTQFIKGYHPTKRLSHGICMAIVSSGEQKTKMLTWIDLLSKKLLQ